MRRFIDRISDRKRPPRKWWYPISEENKFAQDEENCAYHHREASKTISRMILAILGFSLYSLLTLGVPDRVLITADSTVSLPFANTVISFVPFLVIAPLILICLVFYMHIFIDHLARCRDLPENAQAPFIFNLPYAPARVVTAILFYWMPIVVLLAFSWKSLPLPSQANRVMLMAGVTSLILIGLQIRRRGENDRRKNRILWIIFLVVSIFTIDPLVRVSSQGLFEARIIGVERLNTWTLFRRRLNLYGARLSGLEMSLYDLRKANLGDANLDKAVFTGNRLDAAYLRDASLIGTQMLLASLVDANLVDADLTGAKLEYCRLTSANLARANLSGADLTGSLMQNVYWEDAKLSGTRLYGANLQGAMKLTQEQLDTACVDEKTMLPKGLRRPPPCTK